MLRSSLLTVQIALERGLPSSTIMLKASDYFRRPRGSWRPRLRFPKASQGVRSPGAVLVDAESLARPPLADTSAFKKQRYLDSIPDEHSDAADAGLVPGALGIAQRCHSFFSRRR
jgi:hypothetical protein